MASVGQCKVMLFVVGVGVVGEAIEVEVGVRVFVAIKFGFVALL